MKKDDMYVLYYHRLCSMINNDKSFAADNVSFRINYDRSLRSDNVNMLDLSNAHFHLAFCILTENILSKRIKDIIFKAFLSYTSCKPDININDFVNIKKIFNEFYLKMKYLSPTYPKTYCDQLIRDIHREKISKSLMHILTVLLSYPANKFDRRIIIAYLPTIIMTFMINFKGIRQSLQYDEKQASDIADKLTEPKEIIKFQNNNKADRNCDKSILAYAVSVLYNCILNCCSQLNFTISFLWFERKIGAYQYYFTAQEYMDIINIISLYNPQENDASIDISFPCLICSELLKNEPDIPYDSEELQYILETNCKDEAITSNKVKDEPPAKESDFEGINNLIESISMRKDLSKVIKNNKQNSSWRFCLCLIQFMYNHDLLYEATTISKKSAIEFSCKKIITSQFELKNAKFNKWYMLEPISNIYLSYYESPKSFYNIYPTTYLLDKKSASTCIISQNTMKKIYAHRRDIKSTRKIHVKYRRNYDVICNGVCILDNLSAEAVSHKGSIITQIVPNTLYGAKFQDLYVQADPVNKNQFSRNRFCKLFCEFNSSDKINPVVFFGINYYLNISSQNVDKAVNNIAKLYLGGAVFLSGCCLVPELHNYNELQTKLQHYVIELSKSVSGSVAGGVKSGNTVSGECK